MNQAMTREQYDHETTCATCHRPILDLHAKRNINGRLVHIVCPRKPKR